MMMMACRSPATFAGSDAFCILLLWSFYAMQIGIGRPTDPTYLLILTTWRPFGAGSRGRRWRTR